ncbi:MAG: hypothetical protein V4850_01340 [Myxococcota bacterium]
MAEPWVDQAETKKRLVSFFSAASKELHLFGATVNQTFEAHVFAGLISHYAELGWKTKLVHPGKKADGSAVVRLKFSTRGKPSGYTHAVCEKGSTRVQIRHQLRVFTAHRTGREKRLPSVCLDVAVIDDTDLDALKTDDPVPNAILCSFGEAKHMSAYAELVAQFLGIVHEIMPSSFAKPKPTDRQAHHPWPFLFVSGKFYPSAEGIVETIVARALRVRFFNHVSGFKGFPLAMTPAPPKVKKPRPPPISVVNDDDIPF